MIKANLTDDVPSKWVAIVVKYGDGRKHLYSDSDLSPRFFAAENEAQAWSEGFCRDNPRATVLVLQAKRIVKAKPIEFENIEAA